MITPMFGHRPKPRKFNYQFRHHDPEKEKSRRERLRIERKHKKYHQGRSVMLYALGLSLVLYIMYLL
ncbi:hypothetical protein SAMN05443144_108142 [Fodinibius roseus]|uniref:Uncharacterized protein n=1 Tax=Fodinibius roseus TaxID=1194090 RepID=A0A1M5BJW6_9BACT|nr:hypothetical protein [Fodinibius roseus]SHF42482.1 hypothetical protein SAMN05443144_108142 [Fodinibius roseus]